MPEWPVSSSEWGLILGSSPSSRFIYPAVPWPGYTWLPLHTALCRGEFTLLASGVLRTWAFYPKEWAPKSGGLGGHQERGPRGLETGHTLLGPLWSHLCPLEVLWVLLQGKGSLGPYWPPSWSQPVLKLKYSLPPLPPLSYPPIAAFNLRWSVLIKFIRSFVSALPGRRSMQSLQPPPCLPPPSSHPSPAPVSGPQVPPGPSSLGHRCQQFLRRRGDGYTKAKEDFTPHIRYCSK